MIYHSKFFLSKKQKYQKKETYVFTFLLYKEAI